MSLTTAFVATALRTGKAKVPPRAHPDGQPRRNLPEPSRHHYRGLYAIHPAHLGRTARCRDCPDRVGGATETGSTDARVAKTGQPWRFGLGLADLAVRSVHPNLKPDSSRARTSSWLDTAAAGLRVKLQIMRTRGSLGGPAVRPGSSVGRLARQFLRYAAAAAWLVARGAQPDPWDPTSLGRMVDGLLEAQRQAHHFAGAVVVIVLACVFWVGGTASFAVAMSDPNEVAFGLPSSLALARHLWLAGAALTGAVCFGLVRSGRRSRSRGDGRGTASLIVVAALVWIGWLQHWNLLF